MTASGFAIGSLPPRLDARITERCDAISTAHISDSMGRLPGSSRLRGWHGTDKLVGSALTVRVRSGDNLMIHKALDLALPGHVIVVEGGGDTSRALVGELMMLYARTRGVVGFVIDGAIRDVAQFRRYAFPCYALASTHRGPYKEGPGQINVPVTVDGMIVNPGDLIVADEDGVVAVSAAEVDMVLDLATRKLEHEKRVIEAIRSGRSNREWIDKAIAARTGGS